MKNVMRSKGLLALSFCLIATTSLNAQTADFSQDERARGEAIVTAASKYFAATMRDAASAQFRSVHLGKRPNSSPGGKVVVCGQVNGRNAFGGLTGFQNFIASGTDVYVGKVIGVDVGEACMKDRVFDARDYSKEMSDAVQSSY